MAKNSSGSKNPSRIRFIMVDAELGDGDVSQITQAITNALRPPVTNMSMKRIAASVQPNVDQNSDATDVEVVEAELEEIEALDDRKFGIFAVPPRARPPRNLFASRRRVPTTCQSCQNLAMDAVSAA
jgi:hypothetical protein